MKRKTTGNVMPVQLPSAAMIHYVRRKRKVQLRISHQNRKQRIIYFLTTIAPVLMKFFQTQKKKYISSNTMKRIFKLFPEFILWQKVEIFLYKVNNSNSVAKLDFTVLQTTANHKCRVEQLIRYAMLRCIRLV